MYLVVLKWKLGYVHWLLEKEKVRGSFKEQRKRKYSSRGAANARWVGCQAKYRESCF